MKSKVKPFIFFLGIMIFVLILYIYINSERHFDDMKLCGTVKYQHMLGIDAGVKINYNFYEINHDLYYQKCTSKITNIGKSEENFDDLKKINNTKKLKNLINQLKNENLNYKKNEIQYFLNDEKVTESEFVSILSEKI